MELLSMDNYKILQPWILKANWKEYNSNVVTMLMWKASFPTYFEIFNHFAFVCFQNKYGKNWFMPYCEKEYLKEATDTLLSLSNQECLPLSIHSITQEYKNFLEENYPNLVYFEHHEVAEDYVYDRHQQETLSGKKMQKRRNHFNAFSKEYEGRYEYHRLNKNDIPQIYELLEVWKRNKEDGTCDTIKKEEEGIHFLLEHFDDLNLKGGCIYIDGILEAFSIASLISDDMIQIHIEKANKNFRGLYVAILKFLLMDLNQKITYVNREDDMGLPYLKKAKHDMRPIYKVKKYLAIFGEVVIKHPETEEEIHQMQNIWQSSFNDETMETTVFFFNNILKKENAFIISNPNGVMGMAYLNPWTLSFDNTICNTLFLEGVAIDEDYKRCGLMKKLIQHILQEYQGKQFALQAYHWDLYRSFGFNESHYLKETLLEKEAYQKSNETFASSYDLHCLQKIYAQYCKNKNGYRIRTHEYYQEYYVPYMRACHYDILTYKEQGYICLEMNEECIVHEIYYCDKETLIKMLEILSSLEVPVRITSSMVDKIAGTYTIKKALMMYPSKDIEGLFLNEVM